MVLDRDQSKLLVTAVDLMRDVTTESHYLTVPAVLLLQSRLKMKMLYQYVVTDYLFKVGVTRLINEDILPAASRPLAA
jgi:hypothetical protein